MRILVIGDVFGQPGRKTLAKILPELKKKKKIDLVVANAENTHHGKGVSDGKIRELMGCGVDFFTSGNHIWKVPEIYEHLTDKDYPLLRPGNYPERAPGRGYGVVAAGKHNVLVMNLMGRVYMPAHLDDPFQKVEVMLKQAAADGWVMGKNLSASILDFHAEAGSEKMAMGHFLDGRVSLVYGTHTHIPTADEQILSGGTAYITDVGMTGVIDSVIGAGKEEIVENFLTQMPVRHRVAEGPTVFNALLTETDPKTGLARKVERIQIRPISV